MGYTAQVAARTHGDEVLTVSRCASEGRNANFEAQTEVSGVAALLASSLAIARAWALPNTDPEEPAAAVGNTELMAWEGAKEVGNNRVGDPLWTDCLGTLYAINS